jgi:hypothetical protein
MAGGTAALPTIDEGNNVPAPRTAPHGPHLRNSMLAGGA